MGVITEAEIRKHLNKNNEIKTFYIEKNQIVTPSARSYLSEKNIDIKYVDNKKDLNDITENDSDEKFKNKNNKTDDSIKKYKYTTVYGGHIEEKPEHMTQLSGNLLVFKDHKRIVLRGKIDSLETKVLESQLICIKNNKEKLAKDLNEVLSFIRTILRCEVLDEQLEEFTLLGLTPQELREKSHYPKKYFGIDHEYISYEMGEVVVSINSIRTAVREVELTAYEAFKGEYGQMHRQDLMRGLNRLSSLCWILIYKVRTGEYN